ncbi:protein translocase subunit SecF [Candidatus Woesearchaeota archaeon]|nr:protein translocase subunit SecF [Candidatus Woesearchaeota archaeon]
MSRRERKLLRRKGKKYRPDMTVTETNGSAAEKGTAKPKKRSNLTGKILDFYEYNYRKSLWFTIILLVISLIIIGVYTATTGELIPRGVSLKGGVTLTVPYEGQLNIEDLQTYLRGEFPKASISVRAMSSAGERIGFIVDASDADPEELLKAAQARVGDFDKFSLETMGSALGQAFFKQTLLAILVAFALMSVVVFFSFKTFVPSFAVILSAFSDIVMTIAVIDIFRIRIETAGIAALLMLIGYSVDTDVLLTTRVLKREEGTVFDRVMGAMKTGLTMTFTSIAAVIVSLIFTQSETLKQIMIILLIGLIFDLFNTWIQNAGILRIYMEKVSKTKAAQTLADFSKDAPEDEYEHVGEEDNKEEEERKAEEEKKEEPPRPIHTPPHHPAHHPPHHEAPKEAHHEHHKEERKKEHNDHQTAK